MAHSRDWDGNNFPDHSKFKAQPGFVRGLMGDVADRLTDMFYGFASGETEDGVKRIPFRVQASDPSAIPSCVIPYCKDVDGKAEWFIEDEDGNIIQLTSGGKINGPAIGGTIPSECLSAIVQVGIRSPWHSDTPPTGWLLCNGQAISRTTYSALFALIGTVYGSGDGSTTFNLPDYKGKTIIGKDSGQTEFNAINNTGGGKTHTLTKNELPTGMYFGGSLDVAANGGSGGLGSIQQGGGQSFSILNPHIVENWIIKH